MLAHASTCMAMRARLRSSASARRRCAGVLLLWRVWARGTRRAYLSARALYLVLGLRARTRVLGRLVAAWRCATRRWVAAHGAGGTGAGEKERGVAWGSATAVAVLQLVAKRRLRAMVMCVWDAWVLVLQSWRRRRRYKRAGLGALPLARWLYGMWSRACICMYACIRGVLACVWAFYGH